MVTRQRSPSFFFRYHALISPPGPPPTIARSNIVRPAASAAPLPGKRAVSLRTSKRAFDPEEKMNKAAARTAAMKKNKKAGAWPASSRIYFRISPEGLPRRRQGQRFRFRRGRHDRRLLLALVEDQLVALHGDFADLGH